MSLVIPLYREIAGLSKLLSTLEPFVGLHELIFVDGFSDDGTYESLVGAGIGAVLRAPACRPVQMNVGAKSASGHLLLFLHADTELEPEHPELALLAIDRGADAGAFALRIESRDPRLRAASWLISARTRLMRSATGDQALFVRREVFESLGGFREDHPLCEDLDFVGRLIDRRGLGRFAFVPKEVKTSARRWEKSGVSRTIALMWGLRTAFHLGVPPDRLARFYETVR
ncbi:MAG: TIGR04283 family arsenosugar biosynthesis glycosyltransferase [Deltaproteobacteria bacterium]|nr:TIGR04283 family arsenosugar biosynthesis glycosyltransferase [Deltaproteobacteria bacterium]